MNDPDHRPPAGSPEWVRAELAHARQCLRERIEDGGLGKLEDPVAEIAHARRRVEQLEGDRA